MLGCDVVVYTKSKSDRPWVGRCVEVDHSTEMVKVNWFKKRPGRSKTYTRMKDTDPVSLLSVMLWAFTENRTESSFDISSYWSNQIGLEHEKNDEIFETS